MMSNGISPNGKKKIAARLEESDVSTVNRYVSVANGEKVCYGDHTNADNRYDTPPEGNYGVYLTAADQLVVLDVDDYDGGDDLPFDLPDTLVEESPHGGEHLYYHVPVDSDGRMPAAVFKDEIGSKNPVPSWGEVQVANKYVVGAGSELYECGKDWHDCSKRGEGAYTVANDEEITTVEADELVDILLEDEDITEPKTRNLKPGSNDHANDDVDLGVHDVLFSADYPEGERCEHPVHGSSTGTNFQVDPGADTWRCWRHGTTGNALHLIGMQHGIISCGEWQNGGLSSDKWSQIFDAARDDGYDVGEEYEPQAEQVDYEDIDSDQDVREMAREEIKQVFAELNPPEDEDREPIPKKLAIHRFDEIIDTHWHWMYPDAAANGWYNQLYVYDVDRGVYTPTGSPMIRHLCEVLLGSYSDNHVVSELVAKIKRRNRIRALEVDQKKPPAHELVVGNGILNLKTGELRDYTPDAYHTVRVDVDYKPDSDTDCERIDEFFHTVVDPDHVDTLYRLAAHMLLKDYPSRKAALLVGEGSNGKGTVLDLFSAFIGSENTASRGLKKLIEYKFAAQDLHGKLANLEGDLSPNELNDSRMFKKLVGGDEITADVKQANETKEFRNHATMMFAVNSVPQSPEDTHGWWSRWIYIPFPNRFDDDAVPKSKLMDELTADSELEGLLARCVQEIQRYYDTDEFYPDIQSADEVREQIKNAANPIRDFATTAFNEDEDGKILKEHVVNAYKKYAEENDLPRQNSQKLKEEVQNLSDINITSGQSRSVTSGNSRDRVFVGVDWTARGRQLAGIDKPEDDDPQEVIDDTDEIDEQEVIEGGVTLQDVRDYVADNPECDVYEVMREFEFGGGAFDVVKAVIEASEVKSDDFDGDDDDSGSGASVSDTTGDGCEASSSNNLPIPVEIHGVSRDDIRDYIEGNDADVDAVRDAFMIPPEDMDYVRRAVSRWGDGESNTGDGDVEFNPNTIVDDDDAVVKWYQDVQSGSVDVDVVVVPEDEYGPAMELSYGDVEFRTPAGDSL